MTVDGAEGLEQRRGVGQGGRRSISYALDVEHRWYEVGVLRGKGGDGGFEEVAELDFGGFELSCVDGSEVEEGGGRLRDGVYGGAPCDLSDVEDGARVGGQVEPGEVGEAVAEDDDGIGSTGVGPGVSSGTGDGDAKAPAAEGAGDDGAAAAAFEDDGCGDAIAVGGAGEQMAHAAQVADALFADVCGEEDGDGWLDLGVTERGGEGEQTGEAGGVVADAGSLDTGAVGRLARLAGDTCREDGVEVGGEQETGAAGAGRCVSGRRAELGEDVAFVVEVRIVEAELPEAVEEPCGAGLFAEGWCGDADELELPLAKLGLVEMQPVEGSVHGSERSEPGDTALGGGDGHQYSTSTRKRPRAGAVGPAAERERAARIPGMESAVRRPAPMSTKVPTRLRTMWWRKPVPVTR